MSRFLIVCILLILPPLAHSEPPQEKQIAQLISKLGSRRFSERETASRALLEIGEPGLLPLRQAAVTAGDPEVRVRAQRLIPLLEQKVFALEKSFPFADRLCADAALFPDGRSVLCYRRGIYRLQVCDLETGKETVQGEGGNQWGTLCLSYSRDERLLASGDGQGKICLWDRKSGKLLRTLDTGRRYAGVRGVAFSPDSKSLVAGVEGSGIVQWEVATGKELKRIPLEERQTLGKMVMSPTATIFCAAHFDGHVRLWDLNTGKVLHRFDLAAGTVGINFSADGKRIAFGLANGSFLGRIQVRDVATGNLVREFSGHKGGVPRAVAFSPDGALIVSGGQDRKIHVWKVATGEEVHCYDTHKDEVIFVAFRPDGRRILSADEAGLFKLLGFPR